MTAITDAATAWAARKTQNMSPQENARQDAIRRFRPLISRLDACLRNVSQELPPNFWIETIVYTDGDGIQARLHCSNPAVGTQASVTAESGSAVIYSSSAGKQLFDFSYIEGQGVAEYHMREMLLGAMRA